MNPADNHTAVMLAIAGAALVTYSLRFGGLLLSERLPRSGRFKHFMETLPGTILVALVAPGILAAGLWGCFAALVTALLAWKTKNVFIAMLAGMVIVAVSRQMGI